MYAIKFNDKYYASREDLLVVTTNIYNAQLFKDKQIARQTLKMFLKDYERSEGWLEANEGPDSFRVVKVEMREKNEDPFCLNMTTIAVPTPDGAGSSKMYEILEKIQRGAFARPIKEAVPRSPRYTKIVNGKLVTVYHAFNNKELTFDTFEFNIEDEGKTYEWVE